MSVGGASRETSAREAALPAGPPATGPFGRLINLFAEVQAGEMATVLLLMFNIWRERSVPFTPVQSDLK